MTIRLAAVMALLLPVVAAAQPVPERLAYQGRLLKADGTPETGVPKITFSLFDAATGGTALWTEDQDVALTDGFYVVYLGDVKPLVATAFNGKERFLEMSVGGSALSPRQRIGSVPYAMVAGTAVNLSGGTVNATAIQVGGTTVIDATGRLAGPAAIGTTGAGAGVTVDSNNKLSLMTCSADQILKSSGTAWACAPLPSAPTYTAGAGIKIDSATSTISLDSTGCSAGQSLQWSGQAWACAAAAGLPQNTLVVAANGKDPTLTAAGLNVVGAGRVEGYQQQPNAPFSHSHVHSMAVIGTKVYAIGGHNGSAAPVTANVDEYDMTTQSWKTRQPMNIPRYGHSVVGYKGKVYAIGGYNGSTGSLANEIYDPVGNSWTLGPALSGNNQSAAFSGVLGDNKIHIVGGYNYLASTPGPSTTHVVFDGTAWTTAAPLPGPGQYWGAAGVLPDGRMIVAGGYDTGCTARTYIYTPSTDSWKPVANGPGSLYLAHGAVIGGKFHTFMGHNCSSQGNWHYIYDPVTDKWMQGPGVPYTGYAPAVAQLAGGALITSGWNGPDLTTTYEYLGPLFLYGR